MSCPIGTDVARAAGILARGGLVAFATETVYGLGADALDVRAVARIFEVKGRPRFDPLIVHIADRTWLTPGFNRSGTGPATDGSVLAGPLDARFAEDRLVPDSVTAGLPSVGVRIPSHPSALELLRRAGTPIAAPSANLFGQVSPTTAAHVAQQLGSRIDYILEGGPCSVGLESTVLDLSSEVPTSRSAPAACLSGSKKSLARSHRRKSDRRMFCHSLAPECSNRTTPRGRHSRWPNKGGSE